MRGPRSSRPNDGVAASAADDSVADRASSDSATNRRLELTTSEVARRLGVSLGTVRRWADHGHLPSYRTPGGQRRFSAEEVDVFIASLERPGARRAR